MDVGSFGHGDQARAALSAIVSYSVYGSEALSSAETLSHLLESLMPDAPGETNLLVAAAAGGTADKLREHVTAGMDVNTAVSQTASSLAARTALMPQACEWAAGELAVALGLADPARLPVSGQPPGSPETTPRPPAPADRAAQPTFAERQDLTPPEILHVGTTYSVARRAGLGRRAMFVVLTLVAAAVVAGAVVSAVNRLHPGVPANPVSPRAAAQSRTPSAATTPTASSPRSVVKAFIAAVNRHDWPKAWQLGAKNFGLPYGRLVAGFRRTSTYVVTSLNASGNLVTARMLAYETTGAVQTYELSYVVIGGVIVSRTQTLLRTPG